MQKRNYSLSELQDMHQLSVRSVNVCLRYGLLDLESILGYYRLRSSFLWLHNAGRRTDAELTAICKFYEDLETERTDNLPMNDVPNHAAALTNLSELHYEILDRISVVEFSMLSTRAQNCLKNYFDDDISFKKIVIVKRELDKLLSNSKTGLPNSGKKTNAELNDYIDKLHEEYIRIQEYDRSDLVIEYFKISFGRVYQLTETDIEFYCNQIVNGSFPIFKFVNFLIENFRILSEREIFILKHRSDFFIGIDKLSFDEIGMILNLSRERIRQITETIFSKFDSELSFLTQDFKLLRNISSSSYDWDFKEDVIFTSEFYAERINSSEGVRFKPVLITRILNVFLYDTHDLFVIDDREIYDNYWIKKELYSVFSFDELIRDIIDQLSVDIPQTYKLNFEGYLIGFLIVPSEELLARINDVARVIVSRSFTEDLSFDFEGNIEFHRNKSVRTVDFLYSILKEESRPLHVKDILRRIKMIDPNYDGEYGGLRSVLQKEKDTFIYFGRTSTYGLREWEGTIKDIKGGTIRSIVEEYLNKFDEPKHISEIVEYVIKYRKGTNEKSVLSNLSFDRSGKFTMHKGNFWGLTDKNYEPDKINTKKIPNHIRQLIYSYISERGRVPYDQLIEHFCKKFKLKNIQMRYILEKMINGDRINLYEGNFVELKDN